MISVSRRAGFRRLPGCLCAAAWIEAHRARIASLFRWATCWSLLVVAATCAHAQPLRLLTVLKVREFTQSSAAQQEQTGAYALVQIQNFQSTLDPNAVAQLRMPGGATVTLQRAEDGSFWLKRMAGSDAALEAAFPDGNYVLTVGSSAPLSFAVTTGASVDPVLITNFDALQRWPTPDATVEWQPVPKVASGFAAFGLGLQRQNESEPPTFGNRPEHVTSDVIRELPINTPVTGELAYRRTSETQISANGFVIITTGRGFVVRFPMMYVPPPPLIVSHPSSVAVAPEGEIRLTVQASGLAPFTYQWKKDGVAIAGATGMTYSVRQAQVSDVGSYAVDVSNPGGTVTSESAMVVVAPVYRFAVHAGVPLRLRVVDGGAGVGSFFFPHALAFDRSGNLFLADSGTIRKIAADGVVSTIAGQAGTTGSADGIGSAARFLNVSSIAVDAAGNVYIGESTNSTLRKITPTGVVTTLAGQAGQRGFADGMGVAARFQGVAGVAVDGEGNVFVSDSGNHAIRRVTPAGEVSTIAGEPGRVGFANGMGTVARFNMPDAVAIDRSGNLYVVDTGNGAIRLVTSQGRVSTLYAGPSSARFAGIGVNDAGEVYALSGRSVLQISPTGMIAWRGAQFTYDGPTSGLFLGAGFAIDATACSTSLTSPMRSFCGGCCCPGQAVMALR